MTGNHLVQLTNERERRSRRIKLEIKREVAMGPNEIQAIIRENFENLDPTKLKDPEEVNKLLDVNVLLKLYQKI